MQKPSEIVRKRPLVFQNLWDALPAGVRLMFVRGHGAGASVAPAVPPVAASPAAHEGMIVIHPVPHRRAS